MNPVNFFGSNKTLTPPKGMTHEQCSDLRVFSDGDVTVSCWELSAAEKEVVAKTGKVWLKVWAGPSAPPVLVSAEPLVVVPGRLN